MPQTFSLFYNRGKHSLRTLPSLLHLLLFLAVVMLAIFTLNFEVFRVVRIGDLFLLVFALVIGIHWYGQKMLEAGYKDAMKKSSEDFRL